MKLWEKYLLRETAKVFCFFILCFFLVYVLFDYAMHMQQIARNATFRDVALYYLCLLIKRLDLLFPLGFLIATVKVLTGLNARRELVAFLAGGIAMRRLLRPFFFFASACSLVIWTNFQWFSPPALSYIDAFESIAFKTKRAHKVEKPSVHVMTPGGSTLLYQYCRDKTLYDVYYIETPDSIWHMRTLTHTAPPIGHNVDHLVRRSGALTKAETYSEKSFPTLVLDFTPRKKNASPYENRSIAELATLYKLPAASTHLYFKLIMPLLPLILALALPPFCVRFSRTHAPFLTYALSLFGFIAFFALTDAAVILGAKGAAPPFLAVAFLPTVAITLFATLYWKKVA